MKVGVLTSKTCKGCQQLKRAGIIKNIGFVFGTLADINFIEHPLGELDHPKKEFGDKGILRVKDGQLSRSERHLGDGLDYFRERVEGHLATPMFLLEDQGVPGQSPIDSFLMEDLVPESEDESYITSDEPWLGSRLIMKRAHRFYRRYIADIPLEAEGQLQRQPDELEQEVLGIRPEYIIPDLEEGEFQERRWIRAFNKAREPELA